MNDLDRTECRGEICAGAPRNETLEKLDCELSGTVEVDFDTGQGWGEGFADTRIVVD